MKVDELRWKRQQVVDAIWLDRQSPEPDIDWRIRLRIEYERLCAAIDAVEHRKLDAQIRAEAKKAQREWDERQPKPARPPQRMWQHPTEPVEVNLPVPIQECSVAEDLAPHIIQTEIDNRANAMVSHHYATLGRRRSRRYEGFR